MKSSVLLLLLWLSFPSASLFIKITNVSFDIPFELDFGRKKQHNSGKQSCLQTNKGKKCEIWIVKRQQQKNIIHDTVHDSSWYSRLPPPVKTNSFRRKKSEHLKFIFNLKTPSSRRGWMWNPPFKNSIILIPLNVDGTCVSRHTRTVDIVPTRRKLFFSFNAISIHCSAFPSRKFFCQFFLASKYSILCLHMKFSLQLEP